MEQQNINDNIDFTNKLLKVLDEFPNSFSNEDKIKLFRKSINILEEKIKEDKIEEKEELFLAVAKAITIPNQSVFSIGQKARIIKHPEDYVVISKSEFKDILKEVQKSEEFKEICTSERKYGIDIICLKGRSEYVHRNVDVFDGKYVLPVVNYITKLGKESIHNLTLNINRANK